MDSLNNVEYSVRSMLSSISAIYNDNLYVDDLFNFLQEKEMENKSLSNKTFPHQFNEIRFEHVYFKYPGVENYCLQDINITIQSNKIYALVGENGSGKTTLIKLLMGLYYPTEGNIYIDNININDISRESLYQNMGVIFQDFIKYPLSIKENIGIGNTEHIKEEDRILEIGKSVGIDKFVEGLPEKYATQLQKEWEGGVDLSIGQWQKIAIGRALIADSKITILDEPTASLDPKAEYELFKNLKQLMDQKTCLFITHRFANVQLAHEIIVVDKGRIAECNSHENLMKLDGIYAELYKIQSEAYAS
ncbi:ABC transporter ATP-binding protein [Cellulosilyticum ruminicola]|uniref:ABC transporter ATP-binding protein n=1 Tax=Cellulosilyticum ruminicola TaxID=425254 RepID=UPI00155DA0B1|nr:ABC transporter ATP-binding protein [Cellulosilyticum ruminicola]